MDAVRGIVREGKIELLETVDLPEGADVLVTILGEEFLQDEQAWRDAAKKHFLYLEKDLLTKTERSYGKS